MPSIWSNLTLSLQAQGQGQCRVRDRRTGEASLASAGIGQGYPPHTRAWPRTATAATAEAIRACSDGPAAAQQGTAQRAQRSSSGAPDSHIVRVDVRAASHDGANLVAQRHEPAQDADGDLKRHARRDDEHTLQCMGRRSRGSRGRRRRQGERGGRGGGGWGGLREDAQGREATGTTATVSHPAPLWPQRPALQARSEGQLLAPGPLPAPGTAHSRPPPTPQT